MEKMVDIQNFYKNKRVLITGHTGFKGSWLSLWLQKMGAEVYGFSLKPNTVPNLFDLAEVDKNMNSYIGDIRNLQNVYDVFDSAKPEIVFHLAAQPLVLKSYQDPIETYSTNVMGLVNVLEVVRKTKSIKAFVNVTTDKCYQNNEWVWPYRETDPMGGYDPYSSSKGCSELITAAYRSSFFNENEYKHHGVSIASVRAGNVIGGGDWSENRLIPDIFRALIDQKTVLIRRPESIRPWQHVLEPLFGYLLIAMKLFNYGSEYNGAWNFGPRLEDTKTVKWIVENLKKKWTSSTISWEIDNSNANHEATFLKLDITKSSSLLNWSPKLDMTLTIEMIIDWYQDFLSGKNVKETTLRQIEYYQSKL